MAQTDPLMGFDKVVSLMTRIKDSGAKYPRVRLAFADRPLVLTLAGDRARQPGTVNLTDGAGYPNSTFYGRVTLTGRFEPHAAARNLDPVLKAALWGVVSRLREGEAEEVFAEYGRAFGVCCMCGRELTDPESVALGIGPVCRSKAF